MVKLYNNERGVGLHFLNSNSGGGGGSGASGDASGQPGGQQQSQGGEGGVALLDPKLFDAIPLDELDDDTRATIEKIKTGAVATLQRNTELSRNYEIVERNSKQFQSAADKAQAELLKLDPNRNNQRREEPDPYYEIVTKNLQDSGYTEAEIKKLGPMLTNMLKGVGTVQRKQLGEELKPFASSVLANQTTSAFQMAQQNDPLEMLKIPEVAEKTWKAVCERANTGQENDAAIVLNFAKMFWADHEMAKKSGGGGGGGTLPPTPPAMNTGGYTFPGSGAVTSIVAASTNPNGPKTVMNEDTSKAVAASFGTMLKGFEKIKLPAELAAIMPARRGR